MLVALCLLVLVSTTALEIQSRQEFVVQLRDSTVDPAMFAHKHQLEYLGPVTTLEGNYHRFLPKQGTRNTIEDRDGQAIWMERQEPRQQSTRNVIHRGRDESHIKHEEEMRKMFDEARKRAEVQFGKIKFNGPSMNDILFAANHPQEAMKKHQEAMEKEREELLRKNVRGQQPLHLREAVVAKNDSPPAPLRGAGVPHINDIDVAPTPAPLRGAGVPHVAPTPAPLRGVEPQSGATPEMLRELKQLESVAAAPPRGAAATDPLYSQQWHLPVVHASDAWSSGIKGKGVTIAIVDDGLQHTHDDLRANYEPRFSRDYNDGDNDPSPGYSDNHGTSCAGVAAASANNTHCGTGAAPLGMSFSFFNVGSRKRSPWLRTPTGFGARVNGACAVHSLQNPTKDWL